MPFGALDAGESQLGGAAKGLGREGVVLVPIGRMRRHLFGGEGTRRLLERTLVVTELEIHERCSSVALTPAMLASVGPLSTYRLGRRLTVRASAGQCG